MARPAARRSTRVPARTAESQGERQLRRLSRLADVVFALVIWRIFTILPRPDPTNPQWDTILEMFTDQWPRFVVPLLAIVIVVIYWLQNNAMIGRLRATDAVHSGIAIFQLFLLLFFLYTIGVGLGVEAAADSRVFESLGAALVGMAAYLGWWYAWRRGRLLAADVSPGEAQAVATRSLAEPLTAMLTIPFAFIGPLAWELSWFLYPLVRRLIGRPSPARGRRARR